MTRSGVHVMALFSIMLAAGCDALSGKQGDWVSGPIAHDHTTPEGAILTLEDAYKSRDVEAAVKCKDFELEAKLLLKNLETDLSEDEETVAKTTEVLELAYRQELSSGGYPSYEQVLKIVRTKSPIDGRDDLYEVSEQFVYRDGSMSSTTLWVANTPDGWKVITPTGQD